MYIDTTISRKRLANNGIAILALLALVLAGCGGAEDKSSVNPAATTANINSPAQIAQESADDYNTNENGLITGNTLKRWKDDWLNERPAGITGELIILQVEAGAASTMYIKPDGQHVFTHLVDSSEWVQTRSNGVGTTTSMVPDGPTMDAFLTKYGIDPSKDMIVCALGTGGNGQAMRQGRCWYMLRYWGVAKEHLALLNGDNAYQVASGQMVALDDFADTASSSAKSRHGSVRDLPQDNTALQATLQDMLNILPSSDSNVLNDGVFIWDARGMNQYSAGEMVELGQDTDPDAVGTQACATAYCTPTNTANYMGNFQNKGSRQGHPWGALQLNYTNMLDAANGYSYKPKAELAAYLNGEVDGNGLGFVDATYQLVGAGQAYQAGDTVYTYCETTFRAMITGVTSAVILGKPTRFYDGAMTEWNSMSHIVAWDGQPILPVDSPWRTDVVSFYKPANLSSLIEPRQIDEAYATTANAIVYADRRYKLFGSSSSDDSGGGGVAPPPNPCGGS